MTTPASPDEVRAWDRAAIETYGCPEILLMENAGRAVAEEALRLAAGRPGFFAVVCGKGNNGGDGFVAARHLASAGRAVAVFLLAPPEAYPPGSSPRLNLDLLRALRVPLHPVAGEDGPALRRGLEGAALIVDAILGTGLAGEVRGPTREAIEVINGSGVPILAVDIPSGLDGLTGEVRGVAIRAAATVTFVRPKAGLFRGRGPYHAGGIRTVPIGMPENLEKGVTEKQKKKRAPRGER